MVFNPVFKVFQTKKNGSLGFSKWCLPPFRQSSGNLLDAIEQGTGSGVTGAPAFFIDGRLITGTQPLETFVRVIDDELAVPKSSLSSRSLNPWDSLIYPVHCPSHGMLLGLVRAGEASLSGLPFFLRERDTTPR
jgi:hypothetical protein